MSEPTTIRKLLPPMREEELLRQVLELAKLTGWRSFHVRPNVNRSGQWSTAVQGDGAGFPDLVLVRDMAVLWIELKTDSGRLRPEQVAWLSDLKDAGQEVHVWRPCDWDKIEKRLAR